MSGQGPLKPRNGTVYTSYDPANPPPHPGPQWTRFVCISDTHSQTFPVPAGDVLLHSGDLSILGRYEHLKVTMDWLGSLPHAVKIIIAGNHDLPLHKDWYEREFRRFHGLRKEDPTVVRELVDSAANRRRGIVYLQDHIHSFRTKEGGREWTVYGFPWQPYFGGWAFNYHAEEAQGLVSNIPEVDILLTHGPPHMVLDETLHKHHVGCPALYAHLSKMSNPPLLHCFGHIHEDHGAVVHSWDCQDNSNTPSDEEEQSVRETIMVNAANQPLAVQSIMGGRRIPCGGPGFQPVIVDLLDSALR
ncbi:Metallo-dependent phosphatase-like protein [Phlebopus sp. FC_14]|nr:Metallo-dependent phosphatase-like protein [Phlebopus sp. FC_14]